jgi:hypothetical protein
MLVVEMATLIRISKSYWYSDRSAFMSEEENDKTMSARHNLVW